jgi:hypothetical protein
MFIPRAVLSRSLLSHRNGNYSWGRGCWEVDKGKQLEELFKTRHHMEFIEVSLCLFTGEKKTKHNHGTAMGGE